MSHRSLKTLCSPQALQLDAGRRQVQQSHEAQGSRLQAANPPLPKSRCIDAGDIGRRGFLDGYGFTTQFIS